MTPTAAIIPAETVILIAEALLDAERELEWEVQDTWHMDINVSKSLREALAKVRAAKVALQAITDGQ